MEISLIEAHTLPTRTTALARLLMDAVEGGASIGFMAPLSAQDAWAYWYGLMSSLSDGHCLLWVAQEDDVVLGTVQMFIPSTADSRNRAELRKLLVHSSARRMSIGSRLVQTVEQHAATLGRGLVHLEARLGSTAERFFRSTGYSTAGVLPDFALDAHGTLHSTAIHYKQILTRTPAQAPLAHQDHGAY